MRTVLPALLTGAALLLAACSSLPSPETESQSLVVGYLADDYPDGFFDQGARMFDDGLRLEFTNVTRGNRFSLKTSNGFFCFLSNGRDEYLLDRYTYERKEPSGRSYRTGAGIGRKFRATPGKIIYLGHLTVIHKQPEKGREVLKQRMWDYEVSADFEWDEQAVLEFIRSQDPDSPWLEYTIERNTPQT